MGHKREHRGEKQQSREAAAATTSEEAWVCAPALRLTAVWEVPPPAGIEPMNAPAAFAAPMAKSSRFASTGGSLGPTKARAAAIDSVNEIRAMPAAAGHIVSKREGRGRMGVGRPPWIAPMTLTPAASSPSRAEAAMPNATAISGAGRLRQGARRTK